MKRLLTIAAVLLVLWVIAAVVVATRFAPSAGARKAWKEKSIAEISSRISDSAWVSNELARVRARGTNDPGDSDGWLSERLIVMRNGDWLAYANICQKENRRIEDMFVARGSDGRWYYSTFHFCKGMIVLRMEEQAEDLPAFARADYLRSFDGHSDQCLQKTWPPGRQ